MQFYFYRDLCLVILLFCDLFLLVVDKDGSVATYLGSSAELEFIIGILRINYGSGIAICG
jgi:uncharacterized membrane protein YczE